MQLAVSEQEGSWKQKQATSSACVTGRGQQHAVSSAALLALPASLLAFASCLPGAAQRRQPVPARPSKPPAAACHSPSVILLRTHLHHTMFRPSRSIVRAATTARVCARPAPLKLAAAPRFVRAVSSTPKRKDETKPGHYARTDPTINVLHPAEEDLPSSKPVRRFKRTLGSFSLEGKTAVVTGGARG